MGVRVFDPDDGDFKASVQDYFYLDGGDFRVRFKRDYTYKAGFRVTTIPMGRVYTNSISKGYYLGTFGGVTLFEHQIAWLLIHGEWCEGEIDHEDGNRLNNGPTNLRSVTGTENQRNKKLQTNNTSGAPGVSFDRRKGKWIARIGAGSNRLYLGQFDSFDSALFARKEAERELGYHENHGRH